VIVMPYTSPAPIQCFHAAIGERDARWQPGAAANS
jgi:hypothetical protein